MYNVQYIWYVHWSNVVHFNLDAIFILNKWSEVIRCIGEAAKVIILESLHFHFDSLKTPPTLNKQFIFHSQTKCSHLVCLICQSFSLNSITSQLIFFLALILRFPSHHLSFDTQCRYTIVSFQLRNNFILHQCLFEIWAHICWMRRKGNFVLKPTFFIHFAYKFRTESVIINRGWNRDRVFGWFQKSICESQWLFLSNFLNLADKVSRIWMGVRKFPNFHK